MNRKANRTIVLRTGFDESWWTSGHTGIDLCKIGLNRYIEVPHYATTLYATLHTKKPKVTRNALKLTFRMLKRSRGTKLSNFEHNRIQLLSIDDQAPSEVLLVQVLFYIKRCMTPTQRQQKRATVWVSFEWEMDYE